MMKTKKNTNVEKAYWQAVLGRDAAWDGAFIFAVKTTGIFCRPSCPAKTAKRQNVLFFEDASRAEQAGFRACLRCRPKEILADPYRVVISQACQMIAEAEMEPSLDELAAAVGLSGGYFQRVFCARVGLSPKQYAKTLRQQKLQKNLSQAETVTQAIFDSGYQSISRAYSDGAAKIVARHKSVHKAETLVFDTAKSALGNLVMAASPEGICLLEFFEDDPLKTILQSAFPKAIFREDKDALEFWLKKVLAYLETPNNRLLSSLPLDIRGTVFQRKVWQVLRESEAGETLSYGTLAKRMGNPKAQRAVAKACGSNKIGVIIPCHRIVRADGGIGGYRWGTERKRALLAKEKP